MKPYLITAILSFSILLTACKKEGCTDSLAVNYDAEANENDGTCSFQSQTSFWINQNISNWLSVTYGITSLNVYMNDVLVGTMDPTEWKVGPDCGGDNFTVTNDLGSVKAKSSNYEVRDQNGNLQFSGTVSNTANDCTSIELVW